MTPQEARHLAAFHRLYTPREKPVERTYCARLTDTDTGETLATLEFTAADEAAAIYHAREYWAHLHISLDVETDEGPRAVGDIDLT